MDGTTHSLRKREVIAAWRSGVLWVFIRHFPVDEELNEEDSEEGVEKMAISKCYSKMVVSTNSRSVQK